MPAEPDLAVLARLSADGYAEALRPLTWWASRQPWERERAAAALAECRRLLAGGCPGRPIADRPAPGALVRSVAPAPAWPWFSVPSASWVAPTVP